MINPFLAHCQVCLGHDTWEGRIKAWAVHCTLMRMIREQKLPNFKINLEDYQYNFGQEYQQTYDTNTYYTNDTGNPDRIRYVERYYHTYNDYGDHETRTRLERRTDPVYMNFNGRVEAVDPRQDTVRVAMMPEPGQWHTELEPGATIETREIPINERTAALNPVDAPELNLR